MNSQQLNRYNRIGAGNLVEAYQELQKRCEELEATKRFTSVKDGLPTKSKSKKQWLIKLENGDYVAAWWNGKSFHVGHKRFPNATHWKSLKGFCNE